MSPQYPPNPSIKDFPDEPQLEYAIKGTTSQLTTALEENDRIRRCYMAVTGKAVCGEGAIMRIECKEMAALREELAKAKILLIIVLNQAASYQLTGRSAIEDFLASTPSTSAPEPEAECSCQSGENYDPFCPVHGTQGHPSSAPEPMCTCKTSSDPACPQHGLWPEKEPDMVMVSVEDLENILEPDPCDEGFYEEAAAHVRAILAAKATKVKGDDNAG